MRWIVDFEPRVSRTLEIEMQSGRLTRADVKALKIWVADVETNGLEVAQRRADYHDHELRGEWAGHRAIAFSKAGRLIYRVENKKLVVMVVGITPDHDYRR